MPTPEEKTEITPEVMEDWPVYVKAFLMKTIAQGNKAYLMPSTTGQILIQITIGGFRRLPRG